MGVGHRVIKNGYYICPYCYPGREIKLVKLGKEPIGREIYVKCKSCKRQVEIKITCERQEP